MASKKKIIEKNFGSLIINFDFYDYLWFSFCFHVFFFFFFSPVPNRLQDSDGEKSDQDLVVDIANETVSSKELVKRKENKIHKRKMFKVAQLSCTTWIELGDHCSLVKVFVCLVNIECFIGWSHGKRQLCVDFTNFLSICFQVFPDFPSSTANFLSLLFIFFPFIHSYLFFCVSQTFPPEKTMWKWENIPRQFYWNDFLYFITFLIMKIVIDDYQQGSPSPRANGDHSESRDRDSIGLNGDRNGDKAGSSKLNNINDRPPSRSGSSSSRSTPNLKTKDVSCDVNSIVD